MITPQGGNRIGHGRKSGNQGLAKHLSACSAAELPAPMTCPDQTGTVSGRAGIEPATSWVVSM